MPQAAAAPQRPAASRPWLAWLWLLVVLAIAAHQWHFWHDSHLDTDVLALLPQDERQPEVTRATQKLADAAGRRVVVMLGAATDADARRAAAAWREGLPATLGWQAMAADERGAARVVDFYRPWRDRLLTATQRQQLATTPAEALVGRALAALHQPGLAVRLTDWAADPLGLWPAWWTERGGETLARPQAGELMLRADGLEWVVLAYDTGRPAFALDGNAVIGDALGSAEARARQAVPTLRLLKAGVPLHAEAAAVRASQEVNTIGWGSLAAVLLLVWAAFRRLRTLGLVALSLIVGVAAALSATALVFGSVHLITLVFGASLVGVAEDFGIHWFASRQAQPDTPASSLMAELLPGLALALATSVLGYAVLALAPFPGLRQMALFSGVGLTAAFLTVWCWFPRLGSGPVPATAFARQVAGSLAGWPRWTNRPAAWLVLGLAALPVGAGLMRLQTNDSLRQLQASPAALVADQREVGRLLGAPSPSQFFLVTAPDAAAVLAREEALTDRLRALQVQGTLAGWRALSDWVPSVARQQADAALSARTEAAVLAGVNAQLGESITRPPFSEAPLRLDAWLADAASAGARDLWLGDIGAPGHPEWASVVMLRGLNDTSALPVLAAAAEGLPGVRWVDKAADISGLLGRYRHTMSWLLLAGHVLVFAALAWRYRGAAWRAWVPAALASLVALASLGALGLPLQLFNILALLLLLGVGVDYGVFLLEHRGDGAAWLAVVLGATSTALSFGLLALSTTPALRAFGLTLGIGLVVVTLLAPMARRLELDPLTPHA
jgi:predicted exporter